MGVEEGLFAGVPKYLITVLTQETATQNKALISN